MSWIIRNDLYGEKKWNKKNEIVSSNEEDMNGADRRDAIGQWTEQCGNFILREENGVANIRGHSKQ